MDATKTEIWKRIKDFPHYEVSDLGRVRTAHQVLKWQHHGKRGGNYPFVDLRHGKKRRCANIHDLVAEQFLGPRPEGCDVHHKDMNRENPALSNIEYKLKSTHLSEHKLELAKIKLGKK
jgi:hypothetical protein